MSHNHSIIIPEEPRIVCPKDPSYELPISIIDPLSVTPNDEELIQAMAQYKPKTRFKPGDLAYLREIPGPMRGQRGLTIPRIWKIRFVITAWAYELMATVWNHGGNVGMDRAITLLDNKGFDINDARKPMIYAHGYPHGHYPRTACWMSERHLRRVTFYEANQPWRRVVEAAGAQYYGYDAERIPTSFVFSMSPDDYGSGENIGRPFEEEEEVTHAACLVGFEEALFVPITIGEQKRSVARLAPDHDYFAEP